MNLNKSLINKTGVKYKTSYVLHPNLSETNSNFFTRYKRQIIKDIPWPDDDALSFKITGKNGVIDDDFKQWLEEYTEYSYSEELYKEFIYEYVLSDARLWK